jgi:FkbM family methyltransferase
LISYTRNFEDVMLQRAFADIPCGHYVDVGAAEPVYDSNTFALYTKGWLGVAVEPVMPEPMRAAWQRFRPRDVLIEAAIGAQAGRLTIQRYRSGQNNSGSEETRRHWEKLGVRPYATVEVPQMTLTQVVEQHLPAGDWHLLSVDVEGMEDDVIGGLDWQRYRPWVVVVEAVLPGVSTPSHERWEPRLLQAGYVYAWFDAVNRFYVAQEHSQLLEQFRLPPNVWDRFETIDMVDLRVEVEALRQEIERLRRPA